MKCAYFSFQPYLDINRGGQACASIAALEGVSRLVDIDLYYLNLQSNPNINQEALNNIFTNIRNVIIIKPTNKKIGLKKIRNGCAGLPVSLAYLSDEVMINTIQMVHNSDYDIVHYDLIPWMYLHPTQRNRVPTVVSGTDAYSLAYFRKSRYEVNILNFIRDMVSGLAFLNYEFHYLPRAEIVHMFSDTDVNYLKRMKINAQFRQVNMPLEQGWFSDKPKESIKRKFLLSGEHSYPWYKNGVVDFIKHIWPSIYKSFPDAELTIQSTHISDEIVTLTSENPSVKIVGFVNNFIDLFKAHDFFIHPLLTGTGQKNRLALAMAQGLCCIASYAAVDGMGFIPNYEYIPLTLTKNQEFGSSTNLIDIINNQAKCKEIGLRGFEAIKEKFNNNTVAIQLVKLYDEAIKIFHCRIR